MPVERKDLMSLSMEIRLIDAASQKSEICDKILRALPEWFGIEKAIRDYVSAVRDMEMLVAVVNQDVVGFLALKRHNPYTSEIYVLGVLENYHRMGIGRRLVEEAVEFLSRDGVKYLTVKTLSSSNHDPFYAKTRDFYQAMGFLPLEEFKTLWDEGNPCLMLIKSINNLPKKR